MRNRLLLSLLMLMGGMFLGVQAQESKYTILSDVTSKIVNADFMADEPVTETICTYDYDMTKNATSLYGQQAVTGWTANAPSDNTLVDGRTDGKNARAAGIFAYADPMEEVTPGLGSTAYTAPTTADTGFEGQALGLVGVWGSDVQYSQEVTLPAGGYMLVVTLFNNGVDNNFAVNNNGFTTASGKAFLSEKVLFEAYDGIKTDTIVFQLDEETTGFISIGYKAGNVGSGNSPHIFYDNVKLYTIDTAVFDLEALEAAKAELLKQIEIGETYGVDVSAAQAVYDNPNATLEEIQAAIEAQIALNEAGVTNLSDYFITNPHFADGTPVEGGICTYDYDCEKNSIPTTNYSMLNVPGWTQNKTDNGAAAGVFAVGSEAFLGGQGFLPPKTLSDGVTTDANLLGVVTCWGMAVQYKQSVNLPAGKYSIDISYYNAGGAQAVAKNLNGFVDRDGNEYLGEVTTYPVGSWRTETIQFELVEETEGYFTLGYTSANTGSGNMPHLFIDGFSLTYVGTGLNVSLLALRSAVSRANKALDSNFNAALREKLETLLEEAEDLITAQSKDDDANKEATTAITTLMEEVSASIAAYETLQNFLDGELAQAYEKYDETHYPELNDYLGQLLDDVYNALDEGTWENDKIEEVVTSLNPYIKESIQKLWDEAIASGEPLEEDLDISILFDQLAYTYSATAVSNTNVPDKEWQYGDATNFKTQYGTAEVWNQSPFTVSRTLPNMPAGKYTITTKAFFRTADNETNLAMYDPTNTSEAYVFAGRVKTGLLNVAELASEELETLPGAAVVDGLYIPNTQEGAAQLFNNEDYAERLSRSASTVLTSEGDLTFGVAADQMDGNSWVIWHSFSVSYNAAETNDLYKVLEALYQEAGELSNEDDVIKNSKADALLNDLSAEFENVDENSPSEELTTLINQFEDAIVYAKNSISLSQELLDVYSLYSEVLMVSFSSDEPNYNELIGEVGDAINDGYEDNEQIQGFIDALKNGWAAYVQYPVLETSSEENPGDVTAAIYNAGFVDPVSNENNTNGWTRTNDAGNANTGYNEFEFYNANSFDIHQTISGLEEGYYRVRVQGFYRNAGSMQAQADSLEANVQGPTTELYGVTNTNSYSVALKNPFERADEDGELSTDALSVEGEVAANYNGVEEFYTANSMSAFAEYAASGLYWNQLDVYLAAGEDLTIGLKKDEHIAGDWCIFDNFQLFYLGKEAPTAVEGIEADAQKNVNTSSAIYNVAGQRVQKAVKGLYIINGKKILVK